MAMENFTGDGDHKLYEEPYCSVELTGGVHNQLIILSVLNIVLSISAFLGNTLILIALYKDRSLHPPSKLLFRSLAITDLCVGIIVEPFRVTMWLSMVNELWNICRFTFVVVVMTGFFLFSVFVDIVCHKCGQTSRPVVRAQIQTSCNFKANISSCDCFLGFLLGGFHSVPLE